MWSHTAHDERDVVLDEDDGDALGGQLPQQDAPNDVGLGLAPGPTPARRAAAPAGAGAQRPGQLDQPGLAGGQLVGPAPATAVSPTRLEQPVGHAVGVVAPATSAARRTLSWAVSTPKSSSRWKRAGQAEAGPLVGRRLVTSRSPSEQRPAFGGWQPGRRR